jgi:hypothetical protein
MSAQKCPRMVTIVLVVKGRGFRGSGKTLVRAGPGRATAVEERRLKRRESHYTPEHFWDGTILRDPLVPPDPL